MLIETLLRTDSRIFVAFHKVRREDEHFGCMKFIKTSHFTSLTLLFTRKELVSFILTLFVSCGKSEDILYDDDIRDAFYERSIKRTLPLAAIFNIPLWHY